MPKDKLLSKVTHVILKTSGKAYAEKSGIHAVMSLCFGPGDDDCITQVHWKAPYWRLPHVPVEVDGVTKDKSVLKGKLAQEATEWGQVIIDAIKKKYGGVKYRKKYRMPVGTLEVEEEKSDGR